MKRYRAFLVGGIIIILLAAIGFFAPRIMEQEATGNVMRFMGFFLAILLTFIFFILFLGRTFYRRMPPRLFSIVEMVLIAGILGGVVAMFQPWSIVAYKIGFTVVLYCVLGFTVWSHIVPRGAKTEEEEEPVALAIAEF